MLEIKKIEVTKRLGSKKTPGRKIKSWEWKKIGSKRKSWKLKVKFQVKKSGNENENSSSDRPWKR